MFKVAFMSGRPAETAERVERLRRLGHEVSVLSADGGEALRALRRDPPAACVIDLSGRVSLGRDLALALRQGRATRGVALVFVEGEPPARERVRALLPDAAFTTWRALRGALARAVARPTAAPVVPASILAGYSGTPLPKKLGIKPGATVGLVGAPADFEATLGALPAGATLKRAPRGRRDLVLWFAASRAEVEARVVAMRASFGAGGLWICWRKQAAGGGDLTQADVRRIALAHGLVDYKVCAVDAVWSGLKFTRRGPSSGA